MQQQQIAVSGLGGQGVLFVTKLLAEAALRKDLSVLVSETHGMAQRGGHVIGHLKVFTYDAHTAPCTTDALISSPLTSPLIRPGCADVLLALHQESLETHGYLLRPDGQVFCHRSPPKAPGDIDAVGLAKKLGNAVAANMVLLGYAVAQGALFCSIEDLTAVLAQTAGTRAALSLKALEAGAQAASEARMD
ncbi:2-oxoacid:acceptor oxidoreductase family protein [Desulfosoma caldarium]|uniref:Indolepyruvate ferredoxin oxidoreductase beta subunit n=1 Tax=Desulfosoma caldarium TaxID=610254 RepID=A0A3N1VM99_9BACT|nr:2-oxoacid:acceptor oxidoreductase family protein [Desulfosoma caldarium]ROR03080.1 indolepyruvate ferredoxin oxidoreductase beta subunit [Desulfosoma caldarium]